MHNFFKKAIGELYMKYSFIIIWVITQSGAVSNIWGIWVLTIQSYENHFIYNSKGKNSRKGIIWNLKYDEEDFSFSSANNK